MVGKIELTNKQEKFLLGVVKGKSQREAYTNALLKDVAHEFNGSVSGAFYALNGLILGVYFTSELKKFGFIFDRGKKTW